MPSRRRTPAPLGHTSRFAGPRFTQGSGARRTWPTGHRVSAVHLRVDPDAGRGRGLEPQSVGQLGADGCELCRRSIRMPQFHRVVAAVLSRHGIDDGCVRRNSGWMADGDHEVRSRSSSDLPDGCNCWRAIRGVFRRPRISLSNWRPHELRTTTWPGSDLGDVSFINSGAERVNPTTIKRFTQRFARFNLPESAIRPAYGLAEATLFVATNEPGRPTDFVHFEPEEVVGRPRKAMRDRYAIGRVMVCRAVLWCGSSIPRRRPRSQRG